MHSSDKLYLIFLAFSHLSAISSWCDKWYSCAYYEIRIYLCEHRKLPLANSNTFVCRKSQLHKKRAKKMVRSPKPIVFSPSYLANKYMLSKSIAPDTPLEIWCILNKAQRQPEPRRHLEEGGPLNTMVLALHCNHHSTKQCGKNLGRYHC